MDEQERNGLQEIIDNALASMREDAGGLLDLDKVNLAEFCRKSGLSRAKARRLKQNGFKVKEHGRTGMKAGRTVLTDHAYLVDELLRKGVTNSSVCMDRLVSCGYTGSLSTVKDYIRDNASLVPAKRRLAPPCESRGQRFYTGPGEAFQMDWGFTEVEDWNRARYKLACFAMICHHCGTCYIEFFPSARQENLFIGMVHAFIVMGVPGFVLTDNMKSVVVRRDFQGNPIWQSDYASFMSRVGFKTKLCKPRHPFTKGKVERLVRFVKDNFLAGREFVDITQLNYEALAWCADQGGRFRRALGGVPSKEHASACLPSTSPIEMDDEIARYLCPERRISFDGFVSYEGRRFGVPYWYGQKTCRVNRDGGRLHIYSEDLSRELVCHDVTWGEGDRTCEDQFADAQPLELPTAPVKTTIRQLEAPCGDPAFSKFDFEERIR